ncbi:hypothetical protein MMC07_004649 [Pseudocyphellaria aurata]|nr:hypothetical protein [Pseudocyphellaria aurata]
MPSLGNGLRRIRGLFFRAIRRNSRDDEENQEREIFRNEIERLKRTFLGYIPPRLRDAAARALASHLPTFLTPQQQIERLHSLIAWALQQNREREMANPMRLRTLVVPRARRNIAQTRYIDEEGGVTEEMIDVDTRSLDFEEGETAAQLFMHFEDGISEEQMRRFTALALEMAARELEDDIFADYLDEESE